MTTIPRNQEFIEIDFGGDRFTHYPSGDTLMRHPWLREDQNFPKWDEKRRKFFGDHPEAVWLVTLNNVDAGQARVIGDVRDFPWQGGFDVGDVLVMSDANRGAFNARKILDKVEIDSPLFNGDLPHHFLLEDGTTLYWSGMQEAWLAADPIRQDTARVRRILPSEDYSKLRVPSHHIALSILSCALGAVENLRWKGIDRFEEIRDGVETSRNALRKAVNSFDRERNYGFSPPPLNQTLVTDGLRQAHEANRWLATQCVEGQYPGFHAEDLARRLQIIADPRGFDLAEEPVSKVPGGP